MISRESNPDLRITYASFKNGVYMLEERDLAKYPFLKKGAKLFGNILVEDILKLPKFSDAKELAISQIERALGLDRKIFTNDYESRYISYHIARIILSYLHDPILINRFAIMYRDILEKEILKEEPEKILEIFENFSLDVKMNGKFLKISVMDYIRLIKKLGEKYSLLYQKLNDGYVFLNFDSEREKISKIVSEAFVYYFKNDIENLSPPDSIFELLKEDIQKIKVLRDEKISSYSPGEFGELSPESFPPCIREILKSLQRGENISHNARFSLVTFLNQIGMKKEDIYSIFKNVPDFNEKMTDYQIKHITGERGKTVYSTPKCSTMELYNLCVKNIVKDNLCFKEWMTHPLIYYRVKKKLKGSPGP